MTLGTDQQKVPLFGFLVPHRLQFLSKIPSKAVY